MRTLVLVCSCAVATLCLAQSLMAQPFYLAWQKSFGGSGDEVAYGAVAAADSSVFIAGHTWSKDGDITGKPAPGADSLDCWVLKLKADGTALWKTLLGGSAADTYGAVIPASDGGCFFSGATRSNDNGITNNHGGQDVWLARLNPQGGIVWQKAMGGSADDVGGPGLAEADGGLVFVATVASNDGGVSGNHGGKDVWVTKVDATGKNVWRKTLGGTNDDSPVAIVAAADGGYVVLAGSASNDGDVTGAHGARDYWAVKLSAAGAVVWSIALGGSGEDVPANIVQTNDNGFLITGLSQSNDGDVKNNHGTYDAWVVKIDSAGKMLWQKALGGAREDELYALAKMPDNSVVLSGYTLSADGDVTLNHGSADYWTVKLSAEGNMVWQKTNGGSGFDRAMAVFPSDDGGCMIAGNSFSNDIEITDHHGPASQGDYWIVKLSSAGDLQQKNSYGGSGNDLLYAATRTPDNGLVAAGLSTSTDGNVKGNHGLSDFWVMRASAGFGAVGDGRAGQSGAMHGVRLAQGPITGTPVILFDEPYSAVRMKIYDVAGRERLSAQYTASRRIVPDLSGLGGGFYCVQLSDERGRTLNSHLVLQR